MKNYNVTMRGEFEVTAIIEDAASPEAAEQEAHQIMQDLQEFFQGEVQVSEATFDVLETDSIPEGQEN